MLNPKVKYKFLASLLKLLVPVALTMLMLAVLTEFLTQPLEPLDDFLGQVAVDMGVLLLIFTMSAVVIVLFAGRFVSAVYGLGGKKAGIESVIRLVFGKFAFGPVVIVNGGQMTRGLDSVVTKLGGPGGLIIHNDSAVVLQKRGKFNRNVAGPGIKNLEPFEKIYDVIDLRPKRAPLSVKAMTREGIPITWNLEICYQIDDGQQQPSQEKPYPFDPDAVFKAATSKWRREMGRTQDVDWEGWIVNQTEGTLRTIIARRSLDELIGLTEQNSVAAREAIQQELTALIGETVKKVGAQLASIRLYSLAVDDKVTGQLAQTWETHWQNWSTQKLAEEESKRIHKYERDKASAHIEGLLELTKELDQLEQPDRTVALMRLTSMLDQGTMGAGSYVFFPGQAVELLEHVLESTDDSETKKFVPKPVERDDPVSKMVTDADVRIEPNQKLLNFPILGEAAAGKEKPASDDIMGYVQQIGELKFRAKGETGDQLLEARLLKGSKLIFQGEYSYCAVPISGDSMNLAGVCPGDYVIVKKSAQVPVTPQNRDIAIVVFRDEVGDTAILKRILFEHDGSITLKSESSNPANESRTVPRGAFGGDNPSVAVVGIAEAVLRPAAA